MLSKCLAVAAASLLSLGLPAPCVAAQKAEPFSLIDVTGPTADQSDPLKVVVSTKGTPLPESELKNTLNWHLGVVTDVEGSRLVTLDHVEWSAHSQTVALVFKRADSYGVDVRQVGWVVTFIGTQILIASADAPSHGLFKAAKDKDGASIYAFGSILVGPSTKPLYVIDLKADYGNEFGTSGWLWNLGFVANTNTDAEPPVNTESVDPDAIKTSFALVKRRQLGEARMKYTIAPIQGEFARKTGAADAVMSVQAQLDLRPIHGFTLRPSIGGEFGHAIKRPSTIGDTSVDLSEWKGIARVVPQLSWAWTAFKAKPTDDDWYIVTIYGNYSARVPLLGEPSTKPGLIDGERTLVTTVNKDVRHHVEAELDWNFLKYVSLALKYQYGSLPPLFKQVDHQVTLGATVKLKKK
jgi:hypothetical protein